MPERYAAGRRSGRVEAVDERSIARVRVATSSGSIAGNMRDAQLVATELAVRLGVDDAVGAQRRARSRRRRPSSSKSMVRGHVAALRRAWRRTASRTCSPRPSRRGSRPSGRSGRRDHSRPPLLEHPLDLVLEEEQRGERGRVVGLVEAGVARARSPRSSDGGTQRSVAAMRSMRSIAARGAQREPQAAVAARSTSAARSSRRRTAVGSTRSPPAPDVASTSTSDRRRAVGPADVEHHAGRRLVVRVSVHVDVRVGARSRVRARRRSRSPRGRRGAARPR